MIELFSVQYRPGLSQPPMSLLCQSVSVEGEQMMLWLDGINVDDPVVAPLSSMRSISYVGTFRDYAAANLEVARKVFDESSGEHAPSILARAIQYMVADPALTANSAIELACDQALDIIEADQNSARLFTFSATSSPTTTAHAG